MARPKRCVGAALRRGTAQATPDVGYSTLLDVVKSKGPIPGAKGAGAKQAVKLENWRAGHRRAMTGMAWQEDRREVEHAGLQENSFEFEKKPSLVGAGASSVHLESEGDGDFAGRGRNLASEEGAHGGVIPQETRNFGKREHGAEFKCTACGRSVAVVEVESHPVLHVIVCGNCYGFLFSSPFTKDNPQDPFEHENECRWCGDGGEVILCDTCPKAFCKACIKRNFGEKILHAIESPTREWRCFACDDFLLQKLIHDCSNVVNKAKTRKRRGPPRKSKTSRESNPQKRSRRRSMCEATFPSESLTNIMSRKMESLQRKNSETNFTGFKRHKKVNSQPKYRGTNFAEFGGFKQTSSQPESPETNFTGFEGPKQANLQTESPETNFTDFERAKQAHSQTKYDPETNFTDFERAKQAHSQTKYDPETSFTDFERAKQAHSQTKYDPETDFTDFERPKQANSQTKYDPETNFTDFERAKLAISRTKYDSETDFTGFERAKQAISQTKYDPETNFTDFERAKLAISRTKYDPETDFTGFERAKQAISQTKYSETSFTGFESPKLRANSQPKSPETNFTGFERSWQATVQRKSPEASFTIFERLEQLQHSQHHFLLAPNNTPRDHVDTSQRGKLIAEAEWRGMVPDVVQRRFQEHERELHGGCSQAGLELN